MSIERVIGAQRLFAHRSADGIPGGTDRSTSKPAIDALGGGVQDNTLGAPSIPIVGDSLSSAGGDIFRPALQAPKESASDAPTALTSPSRRSRGGILSDSPLNEEGTSLLGFKNNTAGTNIVDGIHKSEPGSLLDGRKKSEPPSLLVDE